MCGICGAADFNAKGRNEPAVRRMTAAMRHRGPDDEGFLETPLLTLGTRRLSIIDLPGGHQPVFNERRTLAVVFNGEIYNFRELRRTLEAQGHAFRTRSDTETIVHAFEAWGKECVHRLQGMFAFALLELPEGLGSAPARLLLARDRLGIKPLYYAFADGLFLFASEVRALLASRQLARGLSRQALEGYLLFGSVSEPTTLVGGMHSLPPGHRMMLSLDSRPAAAQPEAYWSPPVRVAAAGTATSKQAGRAQRGGGPTRPSPAKNGDLGDAPRHVRELLEQSVRGHLIADVPLGIFLSSGLDSTALAALASREQARVHTFTLAFPEQDYNEAALARRTAERFGTCHQELLLSGEEMLARQEEAVTALDQPSMDGINTYFVSWAARQAGLKVALSGLGGDELFGGYSTFRSTPRAQALARLAGQAPALARSLVAATLGRLGEAGRLGDPARKLADLWRAQETLPHPYFFTRALFTPQQVSRLLDGAGSTPAGSLWWAWLAQAAREAETLDGFTAVTHLETRSYLVNTLLRDTDAMSMAHSLEVRVPLLDHHLVEYVAQLPAVVKRRRGVSKALLADALGDLLPAEVVSQRKRTFTLPWEKWLRGALREPVTRGLADLAPALRPVLDAPAVQSVWRDFLAGRTSWSRPWSLYVLNRWAEGHLEA